MTEVTVELTATPVTSTGSSVAPEISTILKHHKDKNVSIPSSTMTPFEIPERCSEVASTENV